MVKFGPSGNSNSFYSDGNTKSEQAFEWLSRKGLDAYEYSFGRGINISDAKAETMRDNAKANGVEISVHAPYYINFANPDEEMIQKSIGYVINSAKKARVLGANRVVFHSATVGKLDRKQAFDLCSARFDMLVDAIYKNGFENMFFCPETMGKINQIGDEKEIALLCVKDKCFLPAIDFGHLNARTLGGLKTEEDFKQVVDNVLDIVGERAKSMHIHFSKIEYTKGGEVRHLTFSDNTYGPDFLPLANVIYKYSLSPVVICESDGTQAEDALYMKKIFNEVVNYNEISRTHF